VTVNASTIIISWTPTEDYDLIDLNVSDYSGWSIKRQIAVICCLLSVVSPKMISITNHYVSIVRQY